MLIATSSSPRVTPPATSHRDVFKPQPQVPPAARTMQMNIASRRILVCQQGGALGYSCAWCGTDVLLVHGLFISRI